MLQVDNEDYGIMAMKEKGFFLCKLDLGVARVKIFTIYLQSQIQGSKIEYSQPS